MAELLGISQQVYSKIATGKMKRPSTELIQKFQALKNGEKTNSENVLTYDVTLADMATSIVKMEAMIKVIMSANAELIALAKGQPVATVLAQLEEAHKSYMRQSANEEQSSKGL